MVVGAGPAGATTAYYLAKQGLDVLMLEAQQVSRPKICGDGVGPRAVLALTEMGLGSWLESGPWYRVERLRLVASSGASITSLVDLNRFPVPYGYVIERSVLDAKLVEHALEAGAEVCFGFKATSLIQDHGRATGVAGWYLAGDQKVKAKLTIVADGSQGELSRQFGQELSRPQAIGMRNYARGVTGIDDCANIYFTREYARGYSWVFPTGPDSANIGVGLLGLGENGTGHRLRQAQSFLEKRQDLTPVSLAGSQLDPAAFGSVMRMNFGRRLIWRPGLTFVGDAAGLVSPINGEGISHAIESGRLVAEAVENNFSSHHQLDRSLADYESQLNQRFRAYFRWGRWLGKILAQPERLDWLIRRAGRDDELRIVFAGMLSNTVHPRELARLSVLRRLLW